jgi:hypothetical protein
MHKTLGLAVALVALAVSTGCGGKKVDGPKSGLAWTPENYAAMSATCKKALACCEDLAKADGAKTAEDFNGKCSGPALWQDGECDTDMKLRVTMLEGESKPVPATCK